jgi:glutamate N-acetyltransferase/amino-acid N-acetyltransferase
VSKDVESPPIPRGFRTFAGNTGTTGPGDDFTVVWSEGPCQTSGTFTQNQCPGASVEISRGRLAAGPCRGIVTIARNANVATGKEGEENALEVAGLVETKLGLPSGSLLIASTGPIGKPYPMEQIRSFIKTSDILGQTANFEKVARGMMTLDTHPKLCSVRCGEGTILGVAKGVGMIEPNMATMLAYFVTDVEVAGGTSAIFRGVVDRTFNCLSVDTDTSTSDTALLFSNGLAGPVDAGELDEGLGHVAENLVRQMASDGEGATKLLTVNVHRALNPSQAKTVAKSVVNSPLVKASVHGGDPNWGRVVMAVGKCSDVKLSRDALSIAFGELTVFGDGGPTEVGRDDLRDYLDREEVAINIDLGVGDASATVWGCDLSEEYVAINSGGLT